MSEQRIVIVSSGGTLPVSVSVVGGISLSGATIASNGFRGLVATLSGLALSSGTNHVQLCSGLNLVQIQSGYREVYIGGSGVRKDPDHHRIWCKKGYWRRIISQGVISTMQKDSIPAL